MKKLYCKKCNKNIKRVDAVKNVLLLYDKC